MPSEAPLRRFNPTPVETSTKSSRDRQKPEGQTVEPVEAANKSSASNGLKKEDTQAGHDSTESTSGSNSDPQSQKSKAKRFLPQPVEISTKSSRQRSPPTDESPSPPPESKTEAKPPTKSRFTPQPIEISTKSSRQRSPPTDESPSPPLESKSEAKPPSKSRFTPQPIEVSTKSSRQRSPPTVQSSSLKSDPTAESTGPAKSKLLPQPVESITKSSRQKSSDADDPPSPQSRTAKPKNLPQPVETSVKTNRKGSSSLDESVSPMSETVEEPKKKSRFAPQLIDTSKRSRKVSDHGVPLDPSHKTDVTPGRNSIAYNNLGQKVVVPAHGYKSQGEESAPPALLPFQRRKERERSSSRGRARTHSFRLPELETIASSGSDHSNPPSLSTTPSSDDDPFADLPVAQTYKHATRIRESIDETFSRYLLELEAKRAELALREQALAAFPNSDFHEPVQHYVDEETDSDEPEIDDRPATWEGHDDDDEFPRFKRRKSSTHGTWEKYELQEHHERMEQERNAGMTTARRVSNAPSPWWGPAHNLGETRAEYDPEMRKMRDQARPPMLGADLHFPRSSSPEPARFDVTQGSAVLRSQMCYLTEQSESSTTSPEGLWGGKAEPKSKKTGNSSRSSQSQQNGAGGGGLWGGFCKVQADGKTNGLMPPTGPSGLLTPRIESGNPFEAQLLAAPPGAVLPITPPAGDEEDQLNHIDGLLNQDRDLDELMKREYPDTFVTQIYNYLSLGYPSLARPFDEELSKISKIPLSELRHDDVLAKGLPRGYIRLGDDFEGRNDGTDQELHEESCARWRALKLYVREWARQEKYMSKPEALAGNWGTGARRGSWAW